MMHLHKIIEDLRHSVTTFAIKKKKKILDSAVAAKFPKLLEEHFT